MVHGRVRPFLLSCRKKKGRIFSTLGRRCACGYPSGGLRRLQLPGGGSIGSGSMTCRFNSMHSEHLICVQRDFRISVQESAMQPPRLSNIDEMNTPSSVSILFLFFFKQHLIREKFQLAEIQRPSIIDRSRCCTGVYNLAGCVDIHTSLRFVVPIYGKRMCVRGSVTHW